MKILNKHKTSNKIEILTKIKINNKNKMTIQINNLNNKINKKIIKKIYI